MHEPRTSTANGRETSVEAYRKHVTKSAPVKIEPPPAHRRTYMQRTRWLVEKIEASFPSGLLRRDRGCDVGLDIGFWLDYFQLCKVAIGLI
jgi:hypothetical protein